MNSEDNLDVCVKKETVPRVHYKTMQEELLGKKSYDELATDSPFVPLSGSLVSSMMIPNDCNVWDHTWVHRQGCDYENTTSVGVLVTRTGRSGSNFLHKAFKYVGLDVSHDKGQKGRDGSVSWPHAIRSETCNLPHFTEKGNIHSRQHTC